MVCNKGSLSLGEPFTLLRHSRSLSRFFEAFNEKINHRLSGGHSDWSFYEMVLLRFVSSFFPPS